MIEIADITAVSDLKILSLIFSVCTPLNERISCLSCSEKSPSGPIMIQIGSSENFVFSIFLLSEFKSVKIKFIELEFKKLFKFCASSIDGTLIRFDCSHASITIFSNRSLLIFLTIVPVSYTHLRAHET